MKKIILTLIMLAIASTVHASTYIIYHNETGEVWSISSEDDAVVPPGANYGKVVLKENINELDLIYPFKCYIWKNNRLITNRAKLDEMAQEEERLRKKSEQEKLIKTEIIKQAIERLKAQNITITEE